MRDRSLLPYDLGASCICPLLDLQSWRLPGGGSGFLCVSPLPQMPLSASEISSCNGDAKSFRYAQICVSGVSGVSGAPSSAQSRSPAPFPWGWRQPPGAPLPL